MRSITVKRHVNLFDYLFIKKNETNERKDVFDVAHLVPGSHDKFPGA